MSAAPFPQTDLEPYRAAIRDLMEELDRRYRHAVAVHRAGVEARWYVRGGQDHRFTTPKARDAEVRRVLADRSRTPADAALRVAAFLRGWVHSRAADYPPGCPGRCLYAWDVGAPEGSACADGVDRCSWYIRS